MSHTTPSDGTKISIQVRGNLKRQNRKQNKTKKIFVKEIKNIYNSVIAIQNVV